MNDDTKYLKCPSCGERISISDAFKKEFECQYEQMLLEVRNKTKKEITEQIRNEESKKNQLQLDALKDILELKDKELLQANKNEIELIKKKAELEAKEKRYELELLRKMESEKEKIEIEVTKRITEDYHLKLAEKEKKLSDIIKQLEESKKRAEQGTSVTKGDVFEEDLVMHLKNEFPNDDIQRIEKGRKGADIIHNIFNRSQKISTLLWEAKNTNNWQHTWIEKLKGDQRETAADYAILISKALPAGYSNFFITDGIFITNDFSIATAIAYILRTHLIKHNDLKNTLKNEDENLRQLFNYLTGPIFKQRIEIIVEKVLKLKENLNKEKAAYEKIWAQREIDYQKILISTARFYGEIKGISNNNLPDIPALELDL